MNMSSRLKRQKQRNQARYQNDMFKDIHPKRLTHIQDFLETRTETHNCTQKQAHANTLQKRTPRCTHPHRNTYQHAELKYAMRWNVRR